MEIHTSKRILDTDNWRNLRVLLTGETDGFKWYVGEYKLPFSFVTDPDTLTRLTSNIVRLAYVDVTGTKLNGITNTSVIDELGIDLYCGCTFTGTGEAAGLLRSYESGSLKDHWFIGEDYAHAIISKSVAPEDIAKHLELETIPSIVKALVVLDVKNLDFRRRDCQQI